MRIIIPTYRRPHDQKTWHTLHPDLRHHVTFVVRPEEAAHFRATYAPSHVVETDETVVDFSTTMQFIFDMFCKERFIYADDDITAFYRRRRFYEPLKNLDKPFASTKLLEAADQRHMFALMLDDLDIPYVGNVGLRQAFLPPYPEMYRHAQANIQLMAVDGAVVKKAGARWDRLKWCSDSDFNLMLNVAGLDTLQRNDFYFTTPGLFVGDGGSNSEVDGAARREETHLQLMELAKLHPDVFKKTARKGQAGNYVSGVVAQRKRYLVKRRLELGIPSLQECMTTKEHTS